MKQMVAFVLAALLVLSGAVFSVAAEDAPSRVIVTSCDTPDGWAGESKSGIPEPVLVTDIDPNGYGVVSYTYSGYLYANGGWRHPDGNGKTPTNGIKLHYNAATTETKSYDITGMNILAFELYVSDASLIENVGFQMELSSAGGPDKQENNLQTTLAGMKGSALEDGWNHMEIPLNMFSLGSGNDTTPMDVTNWNFMRLYNMGEVDLGDAELVLAFDNLYFAKAADVNENTQADNDEEMKVSEHRVPIFGCGMALGNLVPDTAEKTAGASSITYTFGAQTTETNRSPLGYTVDGTGMDTLELDIYLSDLGIVTMFTDGATIGDSGIEIGSASRPDYGELAWKLTNVFAGKSDWKVGWNHVALPLASATETLTSKKDGDDGIAFDISAINHIGIYWVMKAAAPGAMTIKFDNIVLTDAQVNQNAQAERDAAPVIEMAEPLKDVKLATLNADNYESIKAQYAELEKAYDALDVQAQTVVDETIDVGTIIRVVGRALEYYEKTLVPAEPEKPTDTEEPLPDDEKPTDDPVTPPEDVTPPTDDEPVTPPEDDEPVDPSEDEPQPDPEQPLPEKSNSAVIIVVIVAVVVVAAVAVIVVLTKKKKS